MELNLIFVWVYRLFYQIMYTAIREIQRQYQDI